MKRFALAFLLCFALARPGSANTAANTSKSSLSPHAAPNVVQAGTATLMTVLLKSTTSVAVGELVTLTAPGCTSCSFTDTSGNALSQVTTDSTSGSQQFYFTMTKTTTTTAQTVTATFDGGFLSVTFKVTAGPATAGLSTLTTSTEGANAGGTATLTLTALDQYGNVVPTVAASITGGTNVTFRPSGTKTNALGVLTSVVTLKGAGLQNFTGSVGSDAPTTSITVAVGAPSTKTSTLISDSSSISSDNGLANLTATVEDVYGNPISNQSVTFSTTGSGCTFGTPGPTLTDPNGQATTTFSSTKAGAVTITAAAGVTLKRAITVSPGAVSAANSSLAATPTTVTANGSATSKLTVTARDMNNNTIPSQPVSLSAADANGDNLTEDDTFSAGTSTSTQGVLTKTVKTTLASVQTLTAVIGGVTVLQTQTVTFGAGQPTSKKSTLSVTTSTASDGTCTASISFTAADAFSNPVTGDYVGLKSSGSANTFNPATLTTQTDSNGSFSGTMTSTKAEVKTITVSAGGLSMSQTVTCASGVPSGSTSTLVPSPLIAVANGTATTKLTLTVKDAQGNLVPTVSGISITGADATTGADLTAGDNLPSTLTTTKGVATATAKTTHASTQLFTATLGSGGPQVNASHTVTFTPGPPTSKKSTLGVTTSTASDGTCTASISFTALDAFSNPITGDYVGLRSSGSANTFNPATLTTQTDGNGSFSGTMTSTKAEAKTITVSAGGLSMSQTVTCASGVPSGSTSTLVPSPLSVAANGTATTKLTLTVKDAQGNLVPTVPGISITGADATTGADLTAGDNLPSTLTTTNGVATATAKTTHESTQLFTATLGSGGPQVNASHTVTFTAGTLNAGQSTLVLGVGTLPSDSATSTTVTFTAADGDGNPINGVAVQLSAPTGITLAGAVSGRLSGTTGSGSNAPGVFATTVTAQANKASPGYTITAKAGSVTKTASLIVTTPVSTTVSLAASGSSTAPADGTSGISLTVTVQLNGVATAGQTVSLGDTLGASFTTPQDNGDGTYSSTATSTNVGSDSVTATADGVSSNTAVISFVPATTVTIAPNGTTTALANGVSGINLTVAVEVNGVGSTGQTVSLADTLGASFTTPHDNGDGTYSSTVTSGAVGSDSVTATALGATTSALTLSFVTPVPTATLTSNVAVALPNGSAPINLTVSVQQASGASWPGQSVVLSDTQGNNYVVTDNNDGTYSSSVTSTTTGSDTVTATVNGSFTATLTITFNSPLQMVVPRAYQDATLLLDGKVLVVGGYGPGYETLASAELYDPATGLFSDAGSAGHSLTYSTATTLKDGRVISPGGFDSWTQMYGDSWIYTEGSGWAQGPNLALQTRSQMSSILLNNGKVLMVDGAGEYQYCQYANSAELFDPVAGVWSATGSPIQDRDPVPIAMIAGGNVLMAGGNDDNCPGNNPGYAEAEVYDVPSGTWSVVGSMTTGRLTGFGLVGLNNGNGLAISGYTSGGSVYLNSVDLYSASTQMFAPTGAVATARNGFTSTVLPSGKVVIIGGNDANGDYLTSVEIYDPVAGTWSLGPMSLATGRAQHTATLLNDGTILVTGGLTTGGGFLASAEILDESPTPWSSGPAMPVATALGCAGVVDGLFVTAEAQLMNGNEPPTQVYDPVAGAWSERSPPSSGFSAMATGGAANGKLYCAGGCSASSDCNASPSNVMTSYDPVADVWATEPNLPEIHAFTSLAGIGTNLYQVGGIPGCPPCTPEADVAVFDTVGQTWTSLAPLPVGTAESTLVALGTSLYSIGGSIDWTAGGADDPTTNLYIYDTVGQAWSQGASMNAGRLWPDCGAINGKIYCATGYDNSGPIASVEVYDPVANTWTLLSSTIPNPVAEAFGGVLNGALYVAGGSDSGGTEAYLQIFTP